MTPTLRPYQQRAVDDLFAWLQEHDGHPCLVMPTGSGKSHVIAHICREAVENYDGVRVLMLTHVKELIQQNAEKLLALWPDAPLGIYSASIKKKEIRQITFAGIQSIGRDPDALGSIDLVIIDEAHTISHKAVGLYRRLLDDVLAVNPDARIIGLTATPYRLGHGVITDDPAIFDALIEPVSIEELLHKGFLSRLRNRSTTAGFALDGVTKRGGDYVLGELQAAVSGDADVRRVVKEIVELSEGRKRWLVFCAGVEHSEKVAAELISAGIIAWHIDGSTPQDERARVLAAFKSGKLQALTNANVLTTGFDCPDIDLIALLRPTMSPSLYLQMVGRGMRIAEGKKDCLVLDFAGAVATHGPITAVAPPARKGSGGGEAPTKVCAHCAEICHAAQKVCHYCGAEFPPPEKKKASLDQATDIISGEMLHYVQSWSWAHHVSKGSGMHMVRVDYEVDSSFYPVSEYLCVTHSGYAYDKAIVRLRELSEGAGVDVSDIVIKPGKIDSVDAIIARFADVPPPAIIHCKKEGKYTKVERVEFVPF